MKTEQSLYETFEKLILLKLKDFDGKPLNDATACDMYRTIFETLEGVIKQCRVPIDNEALNFIAQQFYFSLSFNNNENIGLNPNIFNKLARVENISTNELALCAMMFKDTDLKIPFLVEIKKRS